MGEGNFFVYIRKVLKNHTKITDTFCPCRFVNDVLHISENFSIANKSIDVLLWRMPIKRSHRKLVVFIVMYL